MKNSLTRSQQATRFPTSQRSSGLPRIFDFMNEMDDFWNRSWNLPDAGEMQNFAAAVDVTENEKEYLFTLDAPGVSEKDIQVSITGRQLSISGERRREEEEKSDRSYRSERVFGSFQRSFLLPDEVNTDEVQASFKDGVLKVRVPKVEAAKAKNIAINSGDRTDRGAKPETESSH